MPTGTSTPPLDPAGETTVQPRSWPGAFWTRRVCLVPTWRGWIVIILMTTVVFVYAFRHMGEFLTVRDPLPGGVLVVEGWVPPYVARETLDEFQRNHYLGIYVTGGPIEEENPYFGYQSYANLTATKLREMGAPAGLVHTVPAPFVARDRTYASAVTLKRELQAEGVSAATINVVSVGPHSRRSRLLYEKAFGSASRIGMIGVPARDFEIGQWWKTSAGFRTVVSEFIAYLYARLVFHPE